MKNFAKTGFYLLLSILGLSYLSLLVFVGAQVATGAVTKGQLVEMLHVLDGQRRYTLPSADFAEYQDFLKDREALRARMTAEYGPPSERAPGLEVVAGELRQLGEAQAVAKTELERAKADTLAANAANKRLEDQLKRERALFASNVAKEAAAIQVRSQEAFAKLVRAYDTAAFGQILERLPAAEAARMVRDYLPADGAQEALVDLPLEVQLRIVPLVEDLNAGLSPPAAAQLFAQRRAIEGTYAMGALEIYQNLRRMNAERAMATLSYLPDDLRAEVEGYFRAPPPAR